MIKKLFLILSVLFCASFSCAYEYIESFNVIFKLNENGEGVVSETITANVEHNKIKRGLYRTIPIEKGLEINVLGLKMDGSKHPYFTEKSNNNLIINFGSNDYIPQGMHTYELTYTITNVVDFHRKYDELYWNVTGNDWQFDINKASFKFIPPEKLEIIENGISFYTGRSGAKKKDAEQISPLYFETTKTLSPYEGFTVAIPFKKGLIKEPLLHAVMRIAPYVILAILIVYCLLTWVLVGKDPSDRGDVLFAPPEKTSPSIAGFIIKRTTDKRLFTAALIDLAIKKIVKISSEDKKIILKRTENQLRDIPPEEQNLLIDLFSEKELVLDGKYNTRVEQATNNFDKNILRNGAHFIRYNHLFVLFPNFLIFLLLLIFSQSIVLSVFFTLFLFAFSIVFSANRTALSCLFSIFTIFFILIFSLAVSSFESIRFILPAAIILAVYASTIDNISPQGKELYLQTLAFRRYILKAEKHRAELSNPEDATRIFADYLPYAYAFGIEGQWIKQFEKILSKEIIENTCKACGGIKTLSSALPSLIEKAGTPPAQSGGGGHSGRSGSFGGGCSGGGHGGGGGGGR